MENWERGIVGAVAGCAIWYLLSTVSDTLKTVQALLIELRDLKKKLLDKD